MQLSDCGTEFLSMLARRWASRWWVWHPWDALWAPGCGAVLPRHLGHCTEPGGAQGASTPCVDHTVCRKLNRWVIKIRKEVQISVHLCDQSQVFANQNIIQTPACVSCCTEIPNSKILEIHIVSSVVVFAQSMFDSCLQSGLFNYYSYSTSIRRTFIFCLWLKNV